MENGMDLIWDEVCCQCFNAYVSVREARLRVAPCGHKFCQNCGSRLPTRGNRNCPAPGCDKFVSKATLSDKPVELTVYEAEIRERRRLSKIFNKPRGAFSTAREYNDYLEQVEVYIMNLVDNIDVDATKAAIQKYEAENAHDIVYNESKRTDTLRREQAAVRREKQAAVSAAAEAKHAEGMRKQQLLQEKAAIAQVAVGDKDARTVRMVNDVDPATGIALAAQTVTAPTRDLQLDFGVPSLAQSMVPRPLNPAAKLTHRPLPRLHSEERRLQQEASGCAPALYAAREIDDYVSSLKRQA